MIAQAICTALANAGVGVIGQNLFWGTLPDTPGPAIGVHDTAGTSGPDTLDGMAMLDTPHAQLVARAETQQEAHDLARDAYLALVAFPGGTLAGQLVDRFVALSPPFQLGPPDSQGNERWLFNIEALRRDYVAATVVRHVPTTTRTTTRRKATTRHREGVTDR